MGGRGGGRVRRMGGEVAQEDAWEGGGGGRTAGNEGHRTVKCKKEYRHRPIRF